MIHRYCCCFAKQSGGQESRSTEPVEARKAFPDLARRWCLSLSHSAAERDVTPPCAFCRHTHRLVRIPAECVACVAAGVRAWSCPVSSFVRPSARSGACHVIRESCVPVSPATTSLFGWLVADGRCWFVLREEYCWLVVADKPSTRTYSASPVLLWSLHGCTHRLLLPCPCHVRCRRSTQRCLPLPPARLDIPGTRRGEGGQVWRVGDRRCLCRSGSCPCCCPAGGVKRIVQALHCPCILLVNERRRLGKTDKKEMYARRSPYETSDQSTISGGRRTTPPGTTGFGGGCHAGSGERRRARLAAFPPCAGRFAVPRGASKPRDEAEGIRPSAPRDSLHPSTLPLNRPFPSWVGEVSLWLPRPLPSFGNFIFKLQ
jgi:hypothetical protein